MAERIIDLRNKEKESDVIRGEEQPRVEKNGQRGTAEIIEWSALEYEKRTRSALWYAVLGIFALLLVIFGIFARSYFFIAFVVLAYTVLILYTKRSPRRLSLSLSRDGAKVGSKQYEISSLKSFWIFEKPDGNELSLETTKTLSPFLRVPLGDLDPKRVRDFLSQYLGEEEHKEFISDEIARNLGL